MTNNPTRDKTTGVVIHPEAGLDLWPAPPELKYMSGQFKLGYAQARDEGLERIRNLREIIRHYNPDDAIFDHEKQRVENHGE